MAELPTAMPAAPVVTFLMKLLLSELIFFDVNGGTKFRVNLKTQDKKF